MQDYSFTKHRIIQWVGILLALGVIAVSYWYFSARAGVKTNTTLTDPLSEGLAGYWKLDDGSGTSATDSSTNANTGTLTNGPTWTTGQIGGAVDMDGNDDYITMGDPSSGALDFGSDDFSVGFWMNGAGYTNQGASTNTAVSKRNDSGTNAAGYSFTYPSTNIISFSIGTGSATFTASHSIATAGDNQWHHYVGTRTGGSIRLYVDGALSTTTSSVSGSVSSTTSLQIGDSGTAGTRNSDAMFDEVRIYNRALSVDEVSDLYRLTSPSGTDTSLKGYWSFNGKDISGTTAYDRSGAGNNGTLTDGPTVTQGKVGQALNFTANDSRVIIADNNVLDLQSTLAGTFSAWIYNNGDIAAYQNIAEKGVNTPTPWQIYLLDNSLNLGFYSDVSGVVDSGYAIPTGKWVHVTVTVTGTTALFYVDGNLVATKTGQIGGNSSQGVVIGSFNSNNDFNGFIDEVRVYNTALTAAQIQSLYKQGQADEVNTGASQAQGTGRLDSGLAGYWKLDDGSGTSATDSSTNANTGTLTNGPTWTTGQIGGAVSLDGTNDFVSIPSSTTLNITPGSKVTTAFWYYSNMGTGTTASLFGGRNATSCSAYAMALISGASTDTLAFYYRDTSCSGIDNVQVASISKAAWHHVVSTYDTVTGVFVAYIDGVQKTTSTIIPGSAIANSGTLTLGQSGASQYFNGLMDEFRFYQRVLSSDEVLDLYRLTSPSGTDTSLKGYWSFNGKDISGTTAYDRSGAGNNGTLTDGPTVTPGKVGQALNFFPNGSDANAYVTMGDPTSGSLDFGSGDFSIGFWMKGRGYSSQGSSANLAISKQGLDSGTQSAGYSFYYTSSNLLIFNVGNGTTGYAATQTVSTVSDNQWHYYTGLRSGNTIYLYVDSNLVASTAVTGSVSTSTAFSIAGDTGNNRNANADIDEVRVYNTALTAAQIQSLYKQGQADEVNTGASQAQGTGRLDSGLAGYWKLDDGSGTSATDSSTNANTGTLTNGPTWTTGQIGGAVDFDGTNDYIDLGSSKTYATTSAPFAISFWMNSDDFSGTNRIPFSFKTDSSNGWSATLLSTVNYTDLSFGKDTASARRFSFPGGFSTSTWYHVAISYNGQGFNTTGNYTAYVNGAPVVINTTGAFQSIDNLNYIGRNRLNGGSGADYWDGRLDEFRFYSRSLSSDEVLDLYRLTSPSGTDTSLKGYWSFNGKDISGTTAYDRSGAGNNGTLTNGPTVTPGKVGQALSFDGTDDKMSFSAFTTGTTFTLSLWVRPNAQIESYGALLIQGTGLQLGLSYRGSAAGSNAGKVSYWDSGGEKLSSTAIADGVWSHIAVVVSAGNLQFYTNSVPNGTASSITSLNLSVMGDNSLSETFKGSIDEVRIYNTALTTAQIQALYNAGK